MYNNDDYDGNNTTRKDLIMNGMYILKDLVEADYKEIDYIVKDLLEPGAYLLSGAPKCGKTILATQIAVAVASGETIFNRKVNKGIVVYCGFEDTRQSFSKRCVNINSISSNDFEENIIYYPERNYINSIFDDIKSQVDDFSKVKLVIIDTFQLLKDCDDRVYSYNSDYDIIEPIDKLAIENNICILLLHHNRKQKSKDPFEQISGTTGLTAGCEGMLLLEKSIENSEGELHIRGRHQRENKLILLLREQKWEYCSEEKPNDDFTPSPLVQAVIDMFANGNTSWYGSATELKKALNFDLSENALSRRLNSSKDILQKVGNIEFSRGRTAEGRWLKLQKIKNCEDSANNDKSCGIENNNAIEYKEENAIE